MHKHVLAASLFAFVAIGRADVVSLPGQPAETPWPTTEWPTGELPAKIDREAFQSAIEDAFTKKASGLGETRELVIGGFTDPQGSRVGLGALLVGFYEGNDLVYAGKVGTGLDTRMLLDLRARLDKLKTDQPPFTKATGLPRVRANWVMPHLTATVAFTEWTVHGKLRHPRLLSVG